MQELSEWRTESRPNKILLGELHVPSSTGGRDTMDQA